MATSEIDTVGLAPKRPSGQLSGVDLFLWVIRIVALLLIVVGAIRSIASGRLSFEEWLSLGVIGLSQGSIYALLALGYTMVYGVMRFINFAHGEVFMVGAMTGFFVSDALVDTTLWQDYVVIALLFVILCAAVVSALVAWMLERIAYRPLRGLPRVVPFITAIGASFFLQYAIRGLFGDAIKSYPNVELLSGKVDLGIVTVQKVNLVTLAAAVGMMVGLHVYINKTRAGKAIRAVAEDQEIARLMGIDVDRAISRVFVIGGALAGAAGVLYGLVFKEVFFFSGFFPGIKAFTAAVLGGIGNIAGAALGGLVLGEVESVGPSLVLFGWDIPSAHQLKDVLAFSVLVLVLIFRPTGLLGERLAEDRT